MKAEEKEIKARIGIANFERRTYPRFNIDLPIEYYQVNSSQSQGGRAGNISEGGLLIYLPENIDMGQQIRIKLFFSSGSELNTVEILTEVVWKDIYLGKNCGEHRSGVRFIDISPEGLTRLKNFIKSLSE